MRSMYFPLLLNALSYVVSFLACTSSKSHQISLGIYRKTVENIFSYQEQPGGRGFHTFKTKFLKADRRYYVRLHVWILYRWKAISK